jgi:hypothetical protein
MSRRGPVAEGPASAGFGDGAEFNIMALVSEDCPSKALPQARRNEHRQQCRSFMTAVPNEARLISRGRIVFINFFHSIRAACERSEILRSRVSDVSVTGTERSGACARPLFFADIISRTQAERSEVQRTESSESRAPLLTNLRQTVCGVWRGRERRPRRASMSIVAEATVHAKARSLSRTRQRQSRQRSRQLVSVMSQERDEALSR